MRHKQLYAALCFLLAAGHLFDLCIGLDLHRSWSAFASLAQVYAKWDPVYLEQPFFVKIISLLSGAAMLPMTVALGIGFLRGSGFTKMLVVFYTGFITASNLIWTWNEVYGPVPPKSWAWAMGLSVPWWIIPIGLTVVVLRSPEPSGHEAS